jgi:hypothetical protein
MAIKYQGEPVMKTHYRGKCITMYESIFRGEDLTIYNPNFWNELFLIKPVVSFYYLYLNHSFKYIKLLCAQIKIFGKLYYMDM